MTTFEETTDIAMIVNNALSERHFVRQERHGGDGGDNGGGGGDDRSGGGDYEDTEEGIENLKVLGQIS
ncbi:hypothetical protein DEO72_LG7g1951 [Vigna unguiculata]|uniref:Uncharacterized protein n=1 Tax=Vigna unguiculata TaxID=3917 RepID=A0A4D6MIW3_VIGUN|nr:hypothetical protein DEO72_LG7g1951 [Vigna unguiculata]